LTDGQNVVHRVGHFSEHPCPCRRQPDAEISIAISDHDVKNFAELLGNILPSPRPSIGRGWRFFQRRSLLLVAWLLHLYASGEEMPV
jgi:hypothetical protein